MILMIALPVEFIFLYVIPRIYRQVRFRVDRRGAGFTTILKQKPIYKALGFLLILAGIYQESLVTTVIGLQASQTKGAGIGYTIRWRDVRQVLLHPEERVVILKERGLGSLRLYCTPENYEKVAAISLEYSGRKNK
jgi:hypothetical protein